MYVENVQAAMPAANVGPQSAALLPIGDAQVRVRCPLDLPSAERHVAVYPTAVFASLTDRIEVLKAIGEITGLVVFEGRPVVAHYFLERHNVGVEFRENPCDTFDLNPAIQPTALVNVVGDNPNSLHGGHYI
jgi:hypothetical protein